MPRYIRTEYIAVRISVVAEDEDGAEEIGNDFVDSLFFDSRLLRERAKQINTIECHYLSSESTGDSEVALDDSNSN